VRGDYERAISPASTRRRVACCVLFRQNMLRKILVPIDFSEASEAALASACELAKTSDAELIVLHVEELAVLPMGEIPYVAPRVYEELEAAVRRRLETRVAQLSAAGLRVRGRFQVGMASQAIADVTRGEQPELIVIGTHGRRGFSRWILGSVAERVVRSSTVPVLTVRSTREPRASR
jgi:nucleotide-binding universal stress UspA family protein